MDSTLTQAAWHKIAFFPPALAQGASGRVGPQFCFDQREDGWRCRAGVLQKVFAQRRHWQSTFSGLQICLVQRQQWDLRVFFPSFTCGFNACPVPRVFCSSIFWQLLLWYDVKRLLSRASSEISWVASSLLTSLCRSWRKSRDDLLFFSSLRSTTCDSGGPGWTCVMETACESKVLHTHVNLLLHFHTDVMLRTIDSIWTQVKESILCSLSSKFPQISTHIRSFQWRFTFVENSNLLTACGHELSEGQSGEKGKDATAHVWFVKTCWKTRFL